MGKLTNKEMQDLTAKFGIKDEEAKRLFESFMNSKVEEIRNQARAEAYETVKKQFDLDKKALVEKAGTTAISLAFLPGFSQGYAIAKGVVAPKEETRIKSIGKNLYNSTPLPLLKKGKEFSLDKNSILILKFSDKN